MINTIDRRKFLKASLATGLVFTLSPLSVSPILANNNRMAILLDNVKCVNCQRCVNACNELYELDPNNPYLKVEQYEKNEMLYKKRTSCMHCYDAPCVKACPTGTLYKGENGFTYINKRTCIGCGYCIKMCPYNIISLHNNKANKCVGCRDIVSRGMLPRCVSACPVRALQFGSVDDMITLGTNSVAGLTNKFPKAKLYGDNILKGLGVLVVIGDDPEAYGYPDKPKVNLLLKGWKDYLHTGGLLVTAAVAATGALTFGVARKNQKNEKNDENGGIKHE